MIKLNDKYAINFDSMNIILLQRCVRGEKSKNAGEEYYKEIGYYGDFTYLIKRLALLEVRTSEGLSTLLDIVNLLKELEEDILDKIIEIKPDIAPYKYKTELEGE